MPVARLAALALAGLLAAAAAASPPPTPEWLVFLARDHAVGLTGRQTPADVTHVRTLLEAALRLDPDQAMAHRWLYELDTLQDRTPDARGHLDRLVQLEPENESAWHQWLQSGAGERALGERSAWLNQQLGRAATNVQRAQVHLELARIAWQRFDVTTARRHVGEALRLERDLPGLARLEMELLDEREPATRRLAVLLRAVSANPVQVDAPWQIGVLLDEARLPDLAHIFYEHAVSVHEATDPDSDAPAEYLRQLSRNALARGDRATALTYGKRAAGADRSSYASSFYLMWLLRATGQEGQARVHQAQLEERFARVKAPEDWPVDLVAAVAWYHCAIEPQPERALLLAEAAAAQAGDDPFVRRVLGWARMLQGDEAGAEETLTPIAVQDPWAAVKLAELLVNQGRGDEATALIRQVRHIPVAGLVTEQLTSLGLDAVVTHPTSELQQAIANFDRQPLLFHRAPWRFLSATVKPVDLSPGVGEPWQVDLVLANKGGFPISLGPDQMVNPTFLLSFELRGDKDRMYPGLLTISVDQRRLLRPGESVSVRRALDLGPLRKAADRTPQQLQRITVRGWLDPQRQGGTWRASATGQELTKVSFNRRPMVTTRESWAAIFAGMDSPNAPTVYRSIRALGGLLAESQYARLGRLRYEPAPIPREKVHAALRDAVGSPIWQVRARALEGLRWTGFDRELLDAVRGCLTDEHWLVRMMAVRLLGQRLGADFADEAARIAASDSDPQVKAMAGCFGAGGSRP